MSTLVHYLVDLDCKDYNFLDQALKDFGHGLYYILMDCVKMQEFVVSFDESDAIFLQFLPGSYDNSKPQLVPCTKYHKLCFQARVLLLPVLLLGKL